MELDYIIKYAKISVIFSHSTSYEVTSSLTLSLINMKTLVLYCLFFFILITICSVFWLIFNIQPKPNELTKEDTTSSIRRLRLEKTVPPLPPSLDELASYLNFNSNHGCGVQLEIDPLQQNSVVYMKEDVPYTHTITCDVYAPASFQLCIARHRHFHSIKIEKARKTSAEIYLSTSNLPTTTLWDWKLASNRQAIAIKTYFPEFQSDASYQTLNMMVHSPETVSEFTCEVEITFQIRKVKAEEVVHKLDLVHDRVVMPKDLKNAKIYD